MSGVIPRNLKNDVSISNRFPEVYKRGTHTQHTHDNSIRRNAMRCISPNKTLPEIHIDTYIDESDMKKGKAAAL